MSDRQLVVFDVSASRRQVHAFLKCLVVLNLIFLAGTWAKHTDVLAFRKLTPTLILSQFNFAKENVVASWYSSMLFLLTGIAALLCWWADWMRSSDNRGRVLASGWMVMAGIFILLSFDEMGSFHEMIGETAVFKKAGSDKRAGWYAFYALIGAVAVFMMVFFFARFRKNRTALLLTVLGVLFFASNPVQEKFEINSWRSAADPSAWKRPVQYLLLEEGSEIFASFCFLFSFLTYAMDASCGKGEGLHLHTRIGWRTGWIITALLLVLLAAKLLIHFNAWNFEGDDNGIPRNWPPAALFFAAFLAAGWHALRADRTARFPLLLLAGTALFSSMYFGANFYGYYGHSFDGNLFSKIPYAWIGLSAAAMILLVTRVHSQLERLALAGWLAALIFSVVYRTSTHLILPTLAGYAAAFCLVAALYIRLLTEAKPLQKA